MNEPTAHIHMPPELVNKLMTLNPEKNVGGFRIARFTEAAKEDLLEQFVGATYKRGMDFEGFVFPGYTVNVFIDDDTLEEYGVDWETAPDEQIKRGILIDSNTLEREQRFLTALENTSRMSSVVAASAAAAGGRRRRGKKTRKGKKASRKTLRRK
jgi:hypothetical protein